MVEIVGVGHYARSLQSSLSVHIYFSSRFIRTLLSPLLMVLLK